MESEFDNTKLFDYTDEELIEHITSLPRLSDYSNIVPLSSRYLAKGYYKETLEDAVIATTFASQLGIRVPSIQRIIREKNGAYCIMDRISGTTLDIAWHDLGWITSLRLAFQLRGIINSLRSVVSESSGSLATGKCRSFFLDDYFRLPRKAKPNEVDTFLNFWTNFVSPQQEVNKTPADHLICPNPVLPSTRSFVFTHHDLAPRNIILDHKDQLWIIDWDCAGFYPRFFEHAGMYNFIPAGWTKFAMWRWEIFTYIATGFYGNVGGWR